MNSAKTNVILTFYFRRILISRVYAEGSRIQLKPVTLAVPCNLDHFISNNSDSKYVQCIYFLKR